MHRVRLLRACGSTRRVAALASRRPRTPYASTVRRQYISRLQHCLICHNNDFPPRQTGAAMSRAQHRGAALEAHPTPEQVVALAGLVEDRREIFGQQVALLHQRLGCVLHLAQVVLLRSIALLDGGTRVP